MTSVIEHFSGNNGASRWCILVGKQKHNAQWPNYILTRLAVLVSLKSHRCRHVTIHHSLQLKILQNISVVKIYLIEKTLSLKSINHER